jgi:hypothetical protein
MDPKEEQYEFNSSGSPLNLVMGPVHMIVNLAVPYKVGNLLTM